MSATDLRVRIDRARSSLQEAKSLLSEARGSLKSSSVLSSDYEREIVRGGRSRYTPEEAAEYTTNGLNDRVMAPKSNLFSDSINSVINGGMGLLGYNTTLRPPVEDNDFYRDYAQYMPGYNIDGIPSGAWAQNAATNHVGHGTGPGNPWDNIRRSLVSQELAAINADLAAGGSGRLSFGDLYQAHVNAYDTAEGGGNRFIDPFHFSVAVYGVPLLEGIGINSGSLTGASIDLLNNPEDSLTEGWAKRMLIAGAELSVPNPFIQTLGFSSAVWNTQSAIEGGMLGDWRETISNLNPCD